MGPVPFARDAAPLVSVVLCARDAAAPLRLRLEGLCGQTLPRTAFEVVVVDDGSTDGTLEAAREFEGRLPLRTSRQRAAGIASARNHGIFCSRGAVVLFLDEGVPEPGLLEAHLEAHRRFPEGRFAVAGDALPAPEHADDPLLRFLERAHDLEWRRGAPPSGALRGFVHLPASGASLKRGLLLHGGVFHHAFRRCGEEVDLACRLSHHGLQVVHAPAAVTRIVAPPSIDDVRARLADVGAAAVLLARRHADPAVRALAGVAGAAQAWAQASPVEGVALRSARELDRLVRLRREEGLEVEAQDLALLERSYRAVFAASRARGVAEAEAQAERAGEPGALLRSSCR